MNHESAQRHLPAGGFRWGWVGDPDRGYGVDQPGGWTYNIFSFMEAQALHDMGKGAAFGSSQKALALSKLIETPFAGYYCPSRRAPAAYSIGSPWSTVNARGHTVAARCDYAANGGDYMRDGDDGIGPDAEGFGGNGWGFDLDDVKNAKPGTVFTKNASNPKRNGLQWKQSVLELQRITDGTSNTYMVGEKYMSPDNYEGLKDQNDDTGDNEGPYTGFNRDVCRTTVNAPQQDTPGLRADHEFGGPHAGGFNMAYCDGSIQFVSFDIDPKVHANAGSRDGDKWQ